MFGRIKNSIRKRLVKLKSFPALGVLDGSTFLLNPSNWIDNRILAKVEYEKEQLEFARHVIASHGLEYVVDIGANIGVYTVLLGRLPQIKGVYSFEPVKRNYNQLCGNIFLNRIDYKVFANNFALGDNSEEAIIHIDKNSTGISRIDLSGTARSLAVFNESEKIQIRRGDDILFLNNELVFIKLDVEGFALRVLSGLKEFLNRNYGLIQIEVDHDIVDCAAALKIHGWKELKTIDGDKYFIKKRSM